MSFDRLLNWLLDIFQSAVPAWLFALTVLLYSYFGPLRQVLQDRQARRDELEKATNQIKEQIAGLVDRCRHTIHEIEAGKEVLENQYAEFDNVRSTLSNQVMYGPPTTSSHVTKSVEKFRDHYEQLQKLAKEISGIDVFDGTADNKLKVQLLLNQLLEIKFLGENARIAVHNKYQEMLRGPI